MKILKARPVRLAGAVPRERLLSLRIFFFLLSFSGIALAQVSQPHRYEHLKKNADDYFNVISLKDEGIVLFRERDKFKNNNRIWELIILDTALQEQKALELEIKERNKMVGYEVVPGYVYFLFRTGETTKNDFELIEVNLSSREESARFPIKPDLDFKLTHFSKTGNSFIFGGYVNNEPAVLVYELTGGLIKVVPGFFQKDTELVDLRVNQNQTFNAVLVDRGIRGDRKLMFRTFNSAGELLLEDAVSIEENRAVQTGITSTLEREDLIVMGNWGEKNSKQSKGFFFLKIDPFSDQKIQYTDLGELDHFLDYLNPKRAAKLKQESEDLQGSGKIPGFSAYVMPYRVIENKSGYLVLAEVYSPASNMSPYYAGPYYYNPYYYNPYGYGGYWPGNYPGMSRMYRPSTYGNNVKNTEDIKTYATVLIAYDGAGKIMWDHSVKLDDMAAPSLEQIADFCVVNNNVYFLYKKESEILIKSVFLPDSQTTETKEKIKPLEPADQIRDERNSEGGTRHWYGNAFYVWGYQTVRNDTKEDRVRDVFYINKVDVNSSGQ